MQTLKELIEQLPPEVQRGDLNLVVQLVERGSLTMERAKDILKAIRPRYRAGVIEHSLERLREAGGNG